jgi:hypothetical protein
MNYKELNGKSIRDGFNEFNKENPHVYAAFEEQAIKAIKKGRNKISSKLIINWIRWNEYLSSTDKSFKINDAYQSYYARHFVEKNPQYIDAFNFRKLRNEDKSQYMQIDDNGQIQFI